MAHTTMEAFNEKLHQAGLRGYWEMRREPPAQPRIIKWSTIRPLLLEAGEVLGLEEAFRRNISGYQIVMPGESAAAHRHTASAMRFVVEGDGKAYTTTNGEQMFMEPGDLLVQPGWGWHDHNNLGNEPVIWIDMLDSSLVHLLDVEFREDWPDGAQQPVTLQEGSYSQFYGSVRPARTIGAKDSSPPVTYKFRDTMAALNRMAAEEEYDPHDGVLLEYANPITGGHTLPTMAARIQMLRPGESTKAHRHTGTVRYLGVQGAGTMVVDKENPTEVAWEPGDSFWVPSWRWHRHVNTSKTEPAIIFSISDMPIAETFGMYKEEGADRDG